MCTIINRISKNVSCGTLQLTRQDSESSMESRGNGWCRVIAITSRDLPVRQSISHTLPFTESAHALMHSIPHLPEMYLFSQQTPHWQTDVKMSTTSVIVWHFHSAENIMGLLYYDINWLFKKYSRCLCTLSCISSHFQPHSEVQKFETTSINASILAFFSNLIQ